VSFPSFPSPSSFSNEDYCVSHYSIENCHASEESKEGFQKLYTQQQQQKEVASSQKKQRADNQKTKKETKFFFFFFLLFFGARRRPGAELERKRTDSPQNTQQTQTIYYSSRKR